MWGGSPRAVAEAIPDYKTYCVGYRANLYDADWRLRCAEADQWRAQEDLAAARHRQFEVAQAVRDQEKICAQYGKVVAESDAAMDDARARLRNSQAGIESAKADLDAARARQDDAAAADARNRIRANENGVADAATDLKLAEADAATLSDIRTRVSDAKGQLPHSRDALLAAHDAVFAARIRVEQAAVAVAQALHDRDEALWLLHREEILGGRAELARTGFRIDASAWGGRMPSDPETVHAHCVRPAAYWAERPVEIQARVAETEAVEEIVTMREIEQSREERFHEVEKVENRVTSEQRRTYAEHVTLERQRLAAEKTERAAADAEHRAIRIPAEEITAPPSPRLKTKAAVRPFNETRTQPHPIYSRPGSGPRSAATELPPEPSPDQPHSRSDTAPEANAKQAQARAEAAAKRQAAADARGKAAAASNDAKPDRPTPDAKTTRTASNPQRSPAPPDNRKAKDPSHEQQASTDPDRR